MLGPNSAWTKIRWIERPCDCLPLNDQEFGHPATGAMYGAKEATIANGALDRLRRTTKRGVQSFRQTLAPLRATDAVPDAPRCVADAGPLTICWLGTATTVGSSPGPSHAGLVESAQNAARSLGKVTLLACNDKAGPFFDNNIFTKVGDRLRHEILKDFGKANRKLKRDQRKRRRP